MRIAYELHRIAERYDAVTTRPIFHNNNGIMYENAQGRLEQQQERITELRRCL